MAKKKGKIRDEERIRLEQIKYRHDFLDRMKTMCDYYGGKGTFDIIPDPYMNILYQSRFRPVKLRAAEGCYFPERVNKMFNRILFVIMRQTFIEIKPNMKPVTVDEFLTLVETIKLGVKMGTGEREFAWGIAFKERLADLIDEELEKKADKIVKEIISTAGAVFSDIQYRVIWFAHEYKEHPSGHGLDNLVIVHIRKPEIKYFKTADGSRPAFRVSWGTDLSGFQEAYVKPTDLGFESVFSKIPFKVYIQAHAFTRLSERIDRLEHFNQQITMLMSLINPTFIKTDENKYLLAYTFCSLKLGYFVCEYIDGDILIKTFLFITNNGTPEGKKLYELSGLGKLDKKYLAIDKLSSFISSDIGENEKLKTMFEQAGCGQLLHLSKAITDMYANQTENQLAQVMTEYLNKEGGAKALFDDEED